MMVLKFLETQSDLWELGYITSKAKKKYVKYIYIYIYIYIYTYIYFVVVIVIFVWNCLSYLEHEIEKFKSKKQSGICGCLLFFMVMSLYIIYVIVNFNFFIKDFVN